MALKRKKDKTKKKNLSKSLLVRDLTGAAVAQISLPEAHARVDSYYFQKNNPLAAKNILTQIIKQVPADDGASLKLFKILLDQRELDQAEVFAEDMLKKHAKSAAVLEAVATFFLQKGNSAEAIALLQKGLKTSSDKGAMLRALGYAYIASGEKKLAIENFERAITLDKHDVPSYWGRIRADIGSVSESLIVALKRSLSAKDHMREDKTSAYFALAWYYEASDTELYWKYLHRANASIAQDHARTLDAFREDTKGTQKLMTKEFVARYENVSSASENPVFIVAPPRSGTTLLELMLGAHSKTVAVGESTAFNYAVLEAAKQYQQPPFIGTWPADEFGQYLASLRKFFLNFSNIRKAGDLRVIDKSIENFGYVGAILLSFPKAKIIRLKRHPMDIVLSCYHQRFEGGHDVFFNLEAIAQYYINFQRQMDYWESLFPGRILTVKYESLVDNQESVVRTALEYCELDWEAACINDYRNASAVRTASEMQVREAVYNKSVAKWEQYEEFLDTPFKIIDSAYPISNY